MGILYAEGGNPAMQLDAERVLSIICAAYPGHPWGVRVDGGVIFIRYMDSRMGGNWGMVIKTKDIVHDAAVLKKEVIMKTGEWLERAGLVRGRDNGDVIAHVEGMPERYQPIEEHNNGDRLP